MNRAARRAARYTKRGRDQHAADTRDICEHGNWKKTDGNGNPMCPHHCGFTECSPAAGRDPANPHAWQDTLTRAATSTPEGRTNERYRQAIAYAQTTRQHGPVQVEIDPTPGDPPPPVSPPPMA